MPTLALEFGSIETLGPLLRKKKISPLELARLHLSRIERLNPQLNAYLTVAAERALDEALAAERELFRGRWRGPLHGIPISLKDNISTRGLRTTAGSAILRDFVPVEDATVTRRLRQAGAVLLGKTNLHEFAFGISTDNPHYGPARNPWALDRIPGGSSGGSTAAIAAGLCVASVGTDTGGSLRIPSALCGTVGFKPTFGRVSVHGVFRLAPSFDHVGPLCRSVADAALMMGVLAGRDALDPTSVARPREDFLRAKTRKRLRLGRPMEYFWDQIDPQVQRIVETALRDLEKQGATLKEISLPSLPRMSKLADAMAYAEARAVHEQAGWFPARSADYGEDLRKRLEMGADVRAVEYIEAGQWMARVRGEFEAALAEVDAIVAPSTPIAAPEIGAETAPIGRTEENVRSALVRLNRPANFTGLPALSVPCGFTKQGLPVGLQIIGRAYDEAGVLGIGRSYEREHEWGAMHPKMALPEQASALRPPARKLHTN